MVYKGIYIATIISCIFRECAGHYHHSKYLLYIEDAKMIFLN